MVLLARAERLSVSLPEDTSTLPPLELVTSINKDRVHNYVIHPFYLSDAITDTCKGVKDVEEFEHIVDNSGVILVTLDPVLTVMPNTTNNAKTLH